MRQIREVLRLKYECGLTHRLICASAGISKGSVSDYLARAATAGLTWAEANLLDDVEVERRLFKQIGRNEPTGRVAVDFAWVHREMRKTGVTLQLLWVEYNDAAATTLHGRRCYQYSQFCDLYADFRSKVELSMRQVHRAGEKAFLDYSGKKPTIVDAATGEVTEVELFVMVLGASNCTFAEATRSQKTADFVGSTVRGFEYFGCTARDDRQRLRDYFVRYFGTKIRMNEIGEREIFAFVKWLAKLVVDHEIAARTARSAKGVVRTMFRDSKLEGVIALDPFAGLPRSIISKPPRRERRVYTREEVSTVLRDERISVPLRVMFALLVYLGLREGEGCGRRWRDWDRSPKPLGSMNVETQYQDEPLKTDQFRKVPVHPELDRFLGVWWEHGFELVFRRKPNMDDFIVPNSRTGGAHTKSSLYKALRRACAIVTVRFEGCHLTRHTMITWARRGGAPRDVIERLTHNAAGAIIDQYTHYDWKPLCEAVLCIDYDPQQPIEKPPETAPGGGVTVVGLPNRMAEAPGVHVAFHVARAELRKNIENMGGGAGNRTRVRKLSIGTSTRRSSCFESPGLRPRAGSHRVSGP